MDLEKIKVEFSERPTTVGLRTHIDEEGYNVLDIIEIRTEIVPISIPDSSGCEYCVGYEAMNQTIVVCQRMEDIVVADIIKEALSGSGLIQLSRDSLVEWLKMNGLFEQVIAVFQTNQDVSRWFFAQSTYVMDSPMEVYIKTALGLSNDQMKSLVEYCAYHNG